MTPKYKIYKIGDLCLRCGYAKSESKDYKPASCFTWGANFPRHMYNKTRQRIQIVELAPTS